MSVFRAHKFCDCRFSESLYVRESRVPDSVVVKELSPPTMGLCHVRSEGFSCSMMYI